MYLLGDNYLYIGKGAIHKVRTQFFGLFCPPPSPCTHSARIWMTPLRKCALKAITPPSSKENYYPLILFFS